MTENRQVLIDSLPEDKLQASNYRIESAPVPEPGDDEVLCRTLVVTIGAGTRAGLQGSASYAGAPKTNIVYAQHRRRAGRKVQFRLTVSR